MGCGASKSVSVITAQPVKTDGGQTKPGLSQQQQQQQQGVGTPKKLPPIKSGTSSNSQPAPSGSAVNGNAVSVEDEKAGKGGVAFSIAVNGDVGNGAPLMQTNSDIDKILRKPLPPRLRHLEPLDSVPVMTPEQLAEKLRKAEEKRERMLEKRRHSKVTKKSKARRELLKAQDFAGVAAAGGGVDLSASSGAGGNLQESLQQKQAIAEQKRLAQLAAVQEKQRLREERARAARERARQMKQEMLESELQIEKDEAADESDTDSWLGDNDTANQNRVHNKKNASAPPLGHQQQQQRDSSGYSSRDASSANDRASDSIAGSRVQTGKTVSTVLEGELDNDFYD